MSHLASRAILLFTVCYWTESQKDVDTVLYSIVFVAMVGTGSAWAIGVFGWRPESVVLQVGLNRLGAFGIDGDLYRTSGLLGSMGRFGSYIAAACAVLVTKALKADGVVKRVLILAITLSLAIAAFAISQ